jgi:hypothetical protein
LTLTQSQSEYIQSLTQEKIDSGLDSESIKKVLDILESSLNEITEIKEKMQHLKDGYNQLKGEQGQPDIQKKSKKNQDYSSVKERKSIEPKQRKGRGKRNDKVQNLREEICYFPKDQLPPDAQLKGYVNVIVQDLNVTSDNICFKIETFHSPSNKKTYRASRPPGFEGEFGPGVIALTYGLKHDANTSVPNIHRFFKHHGVLISKATLSRFLTQEIDQFHQEKDEIVAAGLQSTCFQQIDDTGFPVMGEQYHTHILCNPFYTAYFTTPHKDRLTVLKILSQGLKLKYLFNSNAFELMKIFRIPNKIVQYLRKECDEKLLDEQDLNLVLQELPTKNRNRSQLDRRIQESAAIAWYHIQDEFPAIEVLVSDDAPQFSHIGHHQALCWIHAGRSLKKLNPLVPVYKEVLEGILTEFWDYYRQLEDYRKQPDPNLKANLEDRFTQLFQRKTGYSELDKNLLSIAANKQKLLLVLNYPQIPLHNNAAELGARAQVRKRDVSLHAVSLEGARSVDTFLTLVQTTNKLGINFYEYVYDRITKENNIGRLAVILLNHAGRDDLINKFKGDKVSDILEIPVQQ